MRWRRRLVKSLKWPATLMAAGALILEGLTMVADVELLRAPSLLVGVDHGAVHMRVGEPFGDLLPRWHGPSVSRRSYQETLPWVFPFRDNWGPFRDYSLPLWIPLVVCGLPAGLSWRRMILKKGWRGAGFCLECGYDLRGHVGVGVGGVTAPCPECGNAAS